jgi:hypothetical protein
MDVKQAAVSASKLASKIAYYGSGGGEYFGETGIALLDGTSGINDQRILLTASSH